MAATRGRYRADFTRGENGNVKFLEEHSLRIRIEGATVVTGVLYKKRKLFGWKVIQIEQSRKAYPDEIEFELVKLHPHDGAVPIGLGKYRVVTRAFIPGTTSYENGWDDEFEII